MHFTPHGPIHVTPGGDMRPHLTGSDASGQMWHIPYQGQTTLDMFVRPNFHPPAAVGKHRRQPARDALRTRSNQRLKIRDPERITSFNRPSVPRAGMRNMTSRPATSVCTVPRLLTWKRSILPAIISDRPLGQRRKASPWLREPWGKRTGLTKYVPSTC